MAERGIWHNSELKNLVVLFHLCHESFPKRMDLLYVSYIQIKDKRKEKESELTPKKNTN